MRLQICDRCGKQIDRYVLANLPRNSLYEIHRSEEDDKAAWSRPLNFCDDCASYLSDLIEREINIPDTVTLSTATKWR